MYVLATGFEAGRQGTSAQNQGVPGSWAISTGVGTLPGSSVWVPIFSWEQFQYQKLYLREKLLWATVLTGTMNFVQS